MLIDIGSDFPYDLTNGGQQLWETDSYKEFAYKFIPEIENILNKNFDEETDTYKYVHALETKVKYRTGGRQVFLLIDIGCNGFCTTAEITQPIISTIESTGHLGFVPAFTTEFSEELQNFEVFPLKWVDENDFPDTPPLFEPCKIVIKKRKLEKKRAKRSSDYTKYD